MHVFKNLKISVQSNVTDYILLVVVVSKRCHAKGSVEDYADDGFAECDARE